MKRDMQPLRQNRFAFQSLRPGSTPRNARNFHRCSLIRQNREKQTVRRLRRRLHPIKRQLLAHGRLLQTPTNYSTTAEKSAFHNKVHVSPESQADQKMAFTGRLPAIDVHQRAVVEALARKWAPKPVGKRKPAK